MPDPSPTYFITTIAPAGFSVDGGRVTLRLSVCLDIDLPSIAAKDESQETPDQYASRFAGFYDAFEKVSLVFAEKNISVTRIAPGPKVTARPAPSAPSAANEASKLLWDALFSSVQTNEKGENIGKKRISRISRIGKPVQPRDFGSLHHQLTNLNSPTGEDPDRLTNFLISASNHSKTRRKLAIAKSNRFHADVHNLLDAESAFAPILASIGNLSTSEQRNLVNAEAFLNARDLNVRAYQARFIDPEEFINTFTIINKNTELKRLMGFVIDVHVELEGTLASIAKSPMQFQATGGDSTWCHLVSEISAMPVSVGNETKYAVLLTKPNAHFAYSILRGSEQMQDKDPAGNPITIDCVELLCFDKVGQDEKIKAQREKEARAENVTDTEKADSFTRGIIVNHRKLTEIIEALDYTRKDGAVVCGQVLMEDHFVHGHRVGVRTTEKSDQWHSITVRSVDIRVKNDHHPILHDAVAEGTIHFDSVMHQSDNNANTSYHTSDNMLEWNGQQLTLKSAFSKSTTVTPAEKHDRELSNPDDDNLKLSETKCDNHLLVDTFPFKKVNSPASVQVKYGLPEFREEKVPRLLFGSEYQFVIYHEYKNGWALPLVGTTDNYYQASVAEIVASQEGKGLTTNSITFNPLENKKPVLIYPTRPTNQDVSNPNLQEKESLEHLIIRSVNSGADAIQIAERHVLPERISLEHAFWYGLLFKLPKEETLTWKRKYNCAFSSAEDLNGKKCSEGCGAFCGSTVNQPFYPPPNMVPNHLSDPSIKGFQVKLYWDKACNIPISSLDSNSEYMFAGQAGLAPNSFLLQASDGLREFSRFDDRVSDKVRINVKKGATIYAELVNILTKDGNDHLKNVWWGQNARNYKFGNKVKDDDRNPPKQLTLTHAVKQPLVVPQAHVLASTPDDHRYYVHIEKDWLTRPEYQGYVIGRNILIQRANSDALNASKPLASSYVMVQVQMHVERLDATESGQPFLDNVTPTGALELWMRKEEYVDDPTQTVQKTNGYNAGISHSPEQPVSSFNDPANNFSLEYKVPFSNDILVQMKQASNAKVIGKDIDLFRDILSTVNLQFDLKSTKFELREYYIKNISKFKGYFTSDSLQSKPKTDSLQQLEDYVLPRLEHVKRDESLRFKVMVLNNDKPKQPEVAFAVTTIQETREHKKRHHTNVSQRGNIITVYLKRGRLSSGRDERVGIIVDGGNTNLYTPIFRSKDWISKVGRDILTDRVATDAQVLRNGDIMVPNSYDARFEEDLGIYSFLPEFDTDRQLWKFEVALNILSASKELHNPFVNLSLLHFQPMSVNYNQCNPKDKGCPDLSLDCRISEGDNSSWCYLLPGRKVSVYFGKPCWLFDKYGKVDLTVSFDYESLHHYLDNDDPKNTHYKVRTNFIVQIEGSLDGFVWQPTESGVDGRLASDPNSSKYQQALLDQNMLDDPKTTEVVVKLTFSKRNEKTNFRHFRIRLVEVEWFKDKTWNDMLTTYKDLLSIDAANNEDLRVRFVELIY